MKDTEVEKPHFYVAGGGEGEIKFATVPSRLSGEGKLEARYQDPEVALRC